MTCRPAPSLADPAPAASRPATAASLAASSTAPNWSLRFKQFVIVKNEQIIYTSHPNQEEYAFEFRDRGFRAGSNYYYIRVVQNDGQVAWSSPIWVE